MGAGARLASGAAPATVGQQAVDHDDVQCQDRHREDRIRRDPQHLQDRVDTRARDAEPAGPGSAAPDRERRERLHNAEREQEPSPGAQVAEDVARVGDEEVGLVDRGDPVQGVQDRGDHDHHAGEGDEPLAVVVLVVRVVQLAPL